MKNSTDDFIEIPRWVRLLDGKRWLGGPGLSRRDLHLIEAFCVGCAIVVISASFVVVSKSTAKVLAAIGFIEVVCGYLVAVNIRIGDKYKIWPVANATKLESTVMNGQWRVKTGAYASLFVVGILGTIVLYWFLF